MRYLVEYETGATVEVYASKDCYAIKRAYEVSMINGYGQPYVVTAVDDENNEIYHIDL
jgi:hypothetical protein